MFNYGIEGKRTGARGGAFKYSKHYNTSSRRVNTLGKHHLEDTGLRIVKNKSSNWMQKYEYRILY